MILRIDDKVITQTDLFGLHNVLSKLRFWKTKKLSNTSSNLILFDAPKQQTPSLPGRHGVSSQALLQAFTLMLVAMMPVVAMPVMAISPMMPTMPPAAGGIIVVGIIVGRTGGNVNPRRGYHERKRGRWGRRKAHHNPDPRRVRKSRRLGHKETKSKNGCQQNNHQSLLFHFLPPIWCYCFCSFCFHFNTCFNRSCLICKATPVPVPVWPPWFQFNPLKSHTKIICPIVYFASLGITLDCYIWAYRWYINNNIKYR